MKTRANIMRSPYLPAPPASTRGSKQANTTRNRGTAQEILRRHRRATFPLQTEQAHGILAARDQQCVVQRLARGAGAAAESRSEHLDAHRPTLSGQFEPRARKRRKPTNLVVNLARGARPIDARLGRRDLVGICSALFTLRTRRDLA